MALPEATSGEALIGALQDIEDPMVPIVRHFECKFRKPAKGIVSGSVPLPAGAAVAMRTALEVEGRALIEIPVDLHDESGTHVMSATVEWFIALPGGV
jgi:hypothetical protein